MYLLNTMLNTLLNNNVFVKYISAVVAMTTGPRKQTTYQAAFYFGKRTVDGGRAAQGWLWYLWGGQKSRETQVSETWSERQMGEKRKERKTLETTVLRAQRPWYLGADLCLFIYSFIHKPISCSFNPFNLPGIFLKILRLQDKLDTAKVKPLRAYIWRETRRKT